MFVRNSVLANFEAFLERRSGGIEVILLVGDIYKYMIIYIYIYFFVRFHPEWLLVQ